MTRLAEKRAAGDWSYRLLPRQESAISLAGLRRLDLTEFRAHTLETIEYDKLGRLELIDLFWSTTALDENSFKLFRPSPPQTKPYSI